MTQTVGTVNAATIEQVIVEIVAAKFANNKKADLSLCPDLLKWEFKTGRMEPYHSEGNYLAASLAIIQ